MTKPEDQTPARIPATEALAFLSPASLISAARRSHPAFKFAIAAAGIAGLVAVVSKYGASPATLVFGSILLVVLMVLFLVFSQAAILAHAAMSLAATVLVWSFLTISILTAFCLFTSAFANNPLPIRSYLIRLLNPPSSQTGTTAQQIPANRSPFMTFDDMEQVLDSRGSFSDDFRRQHEGETVEWSVKVIDVEKAIAGNDDSDFLVKFRSKSEDPTKSRYSSEAFFPASLRKAMSDIASGDQIRFRGILAFHDRWYVVVEKCELLQHHPKPR